MTAVSSGMPAPRRKGARRSFMDWVCFLLTWGCAGITVLLLLFLVGYILVRGIPYIKPTLFEMEYTPDNVSLMPALVTTVMMVFWSLLIAAPLGVFSAIYLVEYAKRGNQLVKVVRVTTETLAGIPSIVFGLFGWIFFVMALGWGNSLLAGSFTLAIMILPLIMRTAEESLKAVPDTYREGSFGLGAGRLRTIFRIVLPSAAQGILAGVILAIGRIVGETAALIYTGGSATKIPGTPMESGRTLAIHMYLLSSENLHVGEAYATAVILLVVVIAINLLSAALAKRVTYSKNS